MKIDLKTFNTILIESINEVLLGTDDSFTPYSEKEREQNFKGLELMRNTSYDIYKAWRNKELKKGRKPVELGWETFKKEAGHLLKTW